MTAPSPTVLVYGSVNCDEFFVVDHIVRSGETISSTSYSRRAGGKGANQAVSAARAGAKVDFAGAVGSDGAWLQTELEGYGVNTEHLLRDEQTSTGRAIIQLSSSTADNSIVLFPGANAATNTNRTFDFSQYTHVLVQNEIPWSDTVTALSTAHAEGAITFLNPSPMPSQDRLLELTWTDVDWLLINEGEGHDLLLAYQATKEEEQAMDAQQLLLKLRDTLGGTVSIVMTLGARGALALLPDNTLVSAPAGKVVGGVKDTTGAGDCFTGYLATSTKERTPPAAAVQQALALACQAGAMCVEKPGAMESVPGLEEVMHRVSSDRSAEEEHL
ncbi:hypothetical protein JCM3774_006506 [Rhodotorula dairenensis]